MPGFGSGSLLLLMETPVATTTWTTWYQLDYSRLPVPYPGRVPGN